MKHNRITPFQKVALISTPWPLYNRPSIQIGTLKAHLKKTFPKLNVDAYHFYLKVAEAVGYRCYQNLSERTWLAETVYAALLYPENLEDIKEVFYRNAKGQTLRRDMSFDFLTERVQKVSEEFIHDVDWQEYGLIGFSICLCQLTASLYFIKKIKERFSSLFIVVGGSMFTGDAIRHIFNVFPEIDVVVNGEGEIPLSQLISCLKDVRSGKKIPSIKGIVKPGTIGKEAQISFNQMRDLSGLTPPDYSEYFKLLESLGPEKNFFPILPMEISRGCWWQNKADGSRSTGCAFCNLNLQWDGYRTKQPEQVVSEIDQLTTKHRTLSVAFTDNLLPLKTSRSIFKQIRTLKKDLSMFGEIRATTPARDLYEMHEAGMQEVQIGIEALSTRLLKKLNKGTTAVQNIEIMKHCEMLGIQHSSNLMMHFPGSDEEDVAETLRNLEFTLSFRPLRMVHFWLGLGSPVCQDPENFGIKAVFNHKNYTGIFPKDIAESMQFTIQAYKGDLGYQKRLWQPVKKKLKAWKKAYNKLHQGPKHENILSLRDGGSFLIIRQRRLDGEPLTHRLEGKSRAIYLLCQKHRSIKKIIHRFSSIPSDRIEPFLEMMVDKKLMFRENDRYLSLAVPERVNSLKI
jgi:ribosomal peptide maturation radical SAM protein 1